MATDDTAKASVVMSLIWMHLRVLNYKLRKLYFNLDIGHLLDVDTSN